MKGVFKPEELPENEKVYLKKSFDGWRVVHPWSEEGKINWKNFLLGGSIWNFLKLLFIVAVILFITWIYAHDTEVCRDLISNPCEHYIDLMEMCAPLENTVVPSLYWNNSEGVILYGKL